MLIIDQFIKKMTETAGNMFKQHDNLYLRTGAGAMVQAAKLSDGFVFTETTMAMLVDKLQHFDETITEVYGQTHKTTIELAEAIQTFRGVWIQFHKPIGEVACMLLFVPSRYLATGKDNEMLVLLNLNGEPDEVVEWVSGHGFLYNVALHRCPDCTSEYGVPSYCQRCKGRLLIWSQILSLSAIIAAQYLAERRYEEKTMTIMLHTQREKSHKERRVPLTHVYRVIDANELIIPVQQEQPLHKEERGSWLDGTEVYEEITTRPFTRTYRHPRYVNMQGQTTEFPNGIKRLQPRKVDMLGKKVTKVKASKYEEKDTP